MSLRLTPHFLRRASVTEVADEGDVVVADADVDLAVARELPVGLEQLGVKVDMDAAIEALGHLAAVMSEQRTSRHGRLPPSLSLAQQSELRTFVTDTLEREGWSISGDDVWHAIAPLDRGREYGRLEGRVPADVAERILERLDEALDALTYLDRLRG